MIAQSCHVAFTFAQEHEDIVYKWQNESNYIVILSVKNEAMLAKLIVAAQFRDIKFSVFIEPDLNNEITAIALEPGVESKKLCSNLKLAL